MLDRAEERRRDEIFCAGIVASAVYNVHRAEDSPPIMPDDFVPDKRPDLTDEELADQAAKLFERMAKMQPGRSKLSN